jgi:hypothetical protein
MRPVTQLHVAQLAAFIVAVISFEAVHRLNAPAPGLIYLALTFCIILGFYLFAARFRCPRCGGRLFPPSRLWTPFAPTTCARCGFDTSQGSGSSPSSTRGQETETHGQRGGYESPHSEAGPTISLRSTPRLLRYLALVAAAAGVLMFLHYGVGYMDERNFELTMVLFFLIGVLGVAWYVVMRTTLKSRE